MLNSDRNKSWIEYYDQEEERTRGRDIRQREREFCFEIEKVLKRPRGNVIRVFDYVI